MLVYHPKVEGLNLLGIVKLQVAKVINLAQGLVDENIGRVDVGLDDRPGDQVKLADDCFADVTSCLATVGQ